MDNAIARPQHDHEDRGRGCVCRDTRSRCEHSGLRNARFCQHAKCALGAAACRSTHHCTSAAGTAAASTARRPDLQPQ